MTDSPYLTADEAATYLRVTPQYVTRKCASGEIRARKLGRSWRITREALDAFMAPSRVMPKQERRRAS